jgi:A/G-specific adenine glycosylase
MTASPYDLRMALLSWYDDHARSLPWRISPADRAAGIVPDFYKVWLSEIMLQQTTIVTVKPYFERFLRAFPTIADLAQAPLDRVLSYWAGLGYYARGRNLHACAIAIDRAGAFPTNPPALAALPGVGPYTAAAIASIAFDYPAVPVDGNVERVLSRLLHIDAVLPAAKAIFRDAASQFADSHRPGDFAQALMDLGSILCTPRKPRCHECPWATSCLAYQAGDAENYPRKAAKKIRPKRYGAAFVHINSDGILVARRKDSGLLGGMLEVPSSEWTDQPKSESQALAFAPIPHAPWQLASPIEHIFTHFHLYLDVYVAHTHEPDTANRISLSDLREAGFPSVMMKAIKSALSSPKPRM